ncbi:hypothetical protein P7C70_g9059, partial [Phenoliferia sp. Uapishka_3]
TLPPELIIHILSFACTPSLPFTRCDKCFTQSSLLIQETHHSIRLVCFLWSQLIGRPTTFVCRNITKIAQLTTSLRHSQSTEKRGEGVKSLVLHLREPSHGRRRTCVLGALLRVLLEMCPNLEELTAGGVRMDHPDPTWDAWNGGARKSRVEALLDAASGCKELSGITLLGKNAAVGAQFLLNALPRWQKLRRLSLPHIHEDLTNSNSNSNFPASHSSSIPPSTLPLLEHLSLSICPTFISPSKHFLKVLVDAGALANLVSLDTIINISSLSSIPTHIMDLLPHLRFIRVKLQSSDGDGIGLSALVCFFKRLLRVEYLEIEGNLSSPEGFGRKIGKMLQRSGREVVIRSGRGELERAGGEVFVYQQVGGDWRSVTR